MSREIFQKYGFIVALVIAGIALPTSIISLMREPANVNNYYFEDVYFEIYTKDSDIGNEYKPQLIWT